MNRELIIRSDAEAEMIAAFDWYEARAPELGSEFLLAMDAVVQSVLCNPSQYPIVHKSVRRGLLRRFPYEVFFVVEEKRIIVLAVFHAKRNPERWKERI